MNIGSADSKGAHPGTQRAGPGAPFGGLGNNVERGGRKIDLRVGLTVVEGGRQTTMAKSQHRLHESGDSGRSIKVADVSLDRADRTELAVGGSEGLR